MAPSGSGALGLVGWAFVARSLVSRRKREANRLRDEMIAQERKAKQALEAEVAERRKTEEQLKRAKDLPDKHRQFVETIEKSGDHLLGMNGAEVTRKIIAQYGPDKIKIVAITASVLEHERAGHMASGFHSFLSKPFRFPDVCASLKQFLHVNFEYTDEPPARAAATEEMDASKCSIPSAVWETLKEAADRYSLTALKKAIEPLENNGDSTRQAADCLKRLIHEGDLDRVSAFLDEVKEKGGVA